ncbi:translocase of outer mitochondrial membrane [Hanseniaspora osmophila]
MSSPASHLPVGDFSKLSALPKVQPLAPEQTFWNTNPLFSYLNDVYNNIHSHRKTLSLVNPGSIENLNKEVTRDVFLTQYAFTGLRADLNKAFCLNPVFQTSHTFSIGSQSLPNYAFSAMFVNDNVFAQGNVDNDFSVSGRVNYGWDKNNTSKLTLQMSEGQPTMCQLEHDFQGSDFSLNFKALNPFLGAKNTFTGVAVGSILQSITPNFSLGLETIYSRGQASAPADAAVSYVTRYVSSKKDWIASAQLQANGAVIGSFWRKVAPNVEAGLETQLQASVVPINDPVIGAPIGYQPVIEGVTTLGAKYEYRSSSFRGTVDSNGKVACFVERKILPTLGVLFSGEIDHFKNESKVGAGLQFETAGDEQILMMQQGLDPNGNPLQASVA